jgi:predicted dehydrogenase
MIWNAFILALREIRRSALRSILTTLGIVIGVGSVIAMITLGRGAAAQITSDIANMGTNLLILMPGAERHGPAVSGAAQFKLEDARAMVAAAEASGLPNMIGFNYVRTPATQFVRQLLAEGAIGEVTWFRGEHTEDFLSDPTLPATWRTRGRANGCMGDLAPHPINCMLALMGPVAELNACIETVHATRPGPTGPEQVTNDDHAQIMLRFASGVMGHLYISRTATGRKMGYAYEIHGTRGGIRFDQEDQNSVWLYRAEGPEATRGYTRILTGPYHPDYLAFCQGPGHGTGYQDQIIIEARDFLTAIETGQPLWPSFRDGLEVSQIVETAFQSSDSRQWLAVPAT